MFLPPLLVLPVSLSRLLQLILTRSLVGHMIIMMLEKLKEKTLTPPKLTEGLKVPNSSYRFGGVTPQKNLPKGYFFSC